MGSGLIVKGNNFVLESGGCMLKDMVSVVHIQSLGGSTNWDPEREEWQDHRGRKLKQGATRQRTSLSIGGLGSSMGDFYKILVRCRILHSDQKCDVSLHRYLLSTRAIDPNCP